MKHSFTLFMLLCSIMAMQATNYYVSTDGYDGNDGTSLSTPFATLTKAIAKAQAGDSILVRGGTYKYSSKISLSRNGSETTPICMCAYRNEKPVVNFSSMSTSSSNRGFSLSGSYWIVKGFTVREAGDNGMFISGNYNTVENCVFFKNRDTGLQLGSGATMNRIINCDSYGNADPTDYGDADGFACKMDVGTGNYFYGCRAWLNVDDGWDGYMRGADDVSTVLENCWTWKNGYFLDGSDGGSAANGNGFKVGGSDDKTLMHNFTLINCVAFDNKSKGFDQNNNKGDMKFYNCTSFRNKGKNYSIPSSLNTGKVAEIKNCISINGSQSLGSFVVLSHNSWSGFSFDESDFVSLDTTGVSGPRKADGSLPDIETFHLSDGSVFIDAGIDLGYPYLGSAPDLGAFEYEPASNIFSTMSDDFHLKLNNPVTHTLHVQYQSTGIEEVRLSIVSLNGQLVKSLQLEGGSTIQTIQLDVTDFTSGVYLLVLQSNQHYSSKKFVKF